MKKKSNIKDEAKAFVQIPNEEEKVNSVQETDKEQEAKIDANQVERDEKQEEIDNLKNQLARALADYQNQNKRFQEERAQIFTYASQNVLENLIPVLDILEKAQEHLSDQGLGMAISEFKRVLKEEGLEEIVPKLHNPFDHESMEAVETVDPPERSERMVELVESKAEGPEQAKRVEGIAEVVLNGWKFKDGKVVRYAKVKVYQ